MLEITLKKIAIPLPVDFSMRITVKNPFCFFDKIPFSYSLDFSIPMNEYTSAIFEHPERFAKFRSGNDQKFTGLEVRFSGVLLISGTLSITGVSGGSYNCNLIDLVGVLSEAEQERSILEIPCFATDIPWVNRQSYSPFNSPYCCFPIINANFFDGKSVKVSRISNIPDPERIGKTKTITTETEVLKYCFNKTSGSKVNAKFSPDSLSGYIITEPSTISLVELRQSGNTYEDAPVTVVTPFFYLNYIIKESLKSNSFYLNENILESDATLKKLCIYNNFDITKNEYEQLGSILIAETDVITNDIISAGYPFYGYNRSYGNTLIPKNHLPKMKLGEVLMSTQNLLNVCLDFLPNSQVNIFSRDAILTAQAIDIDKYFIGTWKPDEKKSVALKFTREHDQNDLVFTEQFKNLSDRRGDIKEPVASWALLLLLEGNEEGDIRYVIAVGAFYEFKWITQSKTDSSTNKETTTDVLGWEKISKGYQNGWYKYGRTEVEEIKTLWSTLWGFNYDGGAHHQIAVTRQAGNCNGAKSQQQSFSPRLLIHAEDTYGANETSDLSFEYEKPEIGILAKYWKHTAPFLADRLPVIGSFDMPLNVIRTLIYNKCKKYRTREGEFIFEEFSFDLFIDHISEVDCKAYKVD